MAIKIDFLVKEIYVKIFTKLLGVFRTIFLLFFFSISSKLDNFYFAKSIIGIVILINILFEITYSTQINLFKDNLTFIKKLSNFLNKFSVILSIGVITLTFILSNNIQIISHIIILCFWGILNVNSNFFLILNRYRDANKLVLTYYLLIILLDILLLFLFLFLLTSEFNYLAISLSIFLSELIALLFLFSKQFFKTLKKVKDNSFKFNIEKPLLFKVFLILIVISFIDISDKFFLSFLGEGQITYYTYGLYAPLMIRQSLDIRSNFFVQINKVDNLSQTKLIFFKTIKKLLPFFLLGVIVLLISIEFFESFITNNFKIENYLQLKKIIYLGILITPFYMIWDLFYRFYYREKKINKLIVIVITGLILNIGLNYLIGIKLSLGIYGILISTLIVFIFYNFMSYNYFFLKDK